jgi:hypothetical protein
MRWRMETTVNRVMRHDLPDALIPEQRPFEARQPGKKRWGEDPERVPSRPPVREEDQPREHGFAFVGGWLSFVGELTRL